MSDWRKGPAIPDAADDSYESAGRGRLSSSRSSTALIQNQDTFCILPRLQCHNASQKQAPMQAQAQQVAAGTTTTLLS